MAMCGVECWWGWYGRVDVGGLRCRDEEGRTEVRGLMFGGRGEGTGGEGEMERERCKG